ncbi:MAG TPA: hypothetical protein VGU01_06680 [Sphingomicrobium sp.]|nr:hypothetical protein [Sphingomicrobium sp.]
MLMSTVIAVALGLTPAQDNNGVQLVSGDYSTQIGRYSQFVDHRGKTHLNGIDRRGLRYEVVVDKHGNVEASLADAASFGYHTVSFRVQEAG